MKIFSCDKIAIVKDSWESFKDGRLRVPVTLTRTGIFYYLAEEFFGNEYDKNIFVDGVAVVYRDPKVILNKKSLETLKGMYFTDEHPNEFVNSENWKNYSKGSFGDEVKIREEKYKDYSLFYLDGFLTISDKQTIDLIKSGEKEQISLGYLAEYSIENGNFAGTDYNIKLQDIDFYNHGALVKRGRAGNKVRIGDTATVYAIENKDFNKDKKIDNDNKNLKEDKFIMLIDGREVTLDKAGEVIVENKLSKDKETIEKLQEQVKVIDTLKAEKMKLEKDLEEIKAINLDTLTEERLSIIEKAKTFTDSDFKGLSNSKIKETAVKAYYKDKDLSKESESFFDTAFRLLDYNKKAEPKTPIRDSFANSTGAKPNTTEGISSLVAMLGDAYKESYEKPTKKVESK